MTVPEWLSVFALVSLSATSPGAATQEAQRVNPTAAAIQAFQQRLNEYVEVHNKADGKVPSLGETKDPAKLSERQKALADAIRELRAGAKPGDLFTEEIKPIILDAIRKDFQSRSATDRKALVEEIPPKMALTVNMPYPTSLPLVTAPARMLRALPNLPPELEYRIVGRHLILRDAKANIIVDFMRDVVPTIPS